VTESDSVTEHLQADHRRLDGILAEAQQLAGAGDYPRAAARFAEFSSGLDRHIDLEEQILFPTFESATGMRGGPTQVMRAEHVQIRDSMRTATDALAREEDEVLGEAVHELTETLSAHNMKEEHMLYPMTDRVIGDEQRRQLVGRLRAF
jgi:hemerythrin-like domain-containing protein